MLRFAADENFNNDIVRGVLRRNSSINIVRVQDAGLSGVEDPPILDWCAEENRLLLTHDMATITHYAYQRVRENKPMPGVLEVGRTVPISVAIEDILLVAEFSLDGEWEGQVLYLPLR